MRRMAYTAAAAAMAASVVVNVGPSEASRTTPNFRPDTRSHDTRSMRVPGRANHAGSELTDLDAITQRAAIRDALSAVGTIDEDGVGPAAMAVYLSGGDLHVWCDGSPSGWRWWIVRSDARGVSHATEPQPVTDVAHIERAARALLPSPT